jgi:hypothetical protein
MKTWAIVLAAALSGGAPRARAAEPADLSRYAALLERAPFGAPPPAPPTAAALPPESPLAALRVSAIVESRDGIARAGFVDMRNGRSYFLAVGENDEGLELVSVAFDHESVTVRSGGGVATLNLKEAPAAVPPEPRADVGAGDLGLMRGGSARHNRPPRPAGAAPARAPSAERAAIDRNLQKLQMDVLRRGQPPLPVPLTPEMDAELVREGVLPPP